MYDCVAHVKCTRRKPSFGRIVVRIGTNKFLLSKEFHLCNKKKIHLFSQLCRSQSVCQDTSALLEELDFQ